MIFAKNSQLRNKCLDYIDSWIYLRVIVTSEDNTLCSCCSVMGLSRHQSLCFGLLTPPLYVSMSAKQE